MRVMRAAVAAPQPAAAAVAAVVATRTVQLAARPATANRAINMSATTGSRLTARKAAQQHQHVARCIIRWAKFGRTVIVRRASAARSTMPSVLTAMPPVQRVRTVTGHKAIVRLAKCHAASVHKAIARAVIVRKGIVRKGIARKETGPKVRAVRAAAAVMAAAARAAASAAARAAAN